MRQIGTLPDQQQANRFSDYLLALGITASAVEEDGKWLIWVSDEDQLATARQTLVAFTEHPSDPKYTGAEAKAEQIRKQKKAKHVARSRQMVDVRSDVWGPPNARQMPLTVALIGISIAVTLLSSFGHRPQHTPMRELAFCDPTHQELDFDPSRDGLVDIESGEVWRALTPIFIHYDLMHIAFNMLLFYPLAGQIESRRSSLLLGLLVLGIGLFSNLGQYFVSHNPWFGGMSGVVYGLLGYIWVRMWRSPGDGLRVQRQTVVILVVWLVLGFSGALSYFFQMQVANWAHLFGLIAGAGIAALLPPAARHRKK
jgi:GlpG protein